ncbi:MAG: hypothetical protein ACRDK1_00615 [Solirubrobacterales bacterium]
MSNDRPSSKAEGLAKIEAMQRDADQVGRDQAVEQEGRRQLALLRAELLKLGVVDPDEFAEKATGKWWDSPIGAELRAWVVIDGVTYERCRNGAIRVEREAQGGLEWTYLDADGTPITPWAWEPPPISQQASN